MSWLHATDSKKDQYELLVHIGSGSVGVAIIDAHKLATEKSVDKSFLWLHREYVLIRNAKSPSHTQQEIKTALINAFLEFGSTGQKALHNADASSIIKKATLCIGAPWAHTATKKVVYKNTLPFKLTRLIVEELAETAQQKITDEILTLGVFGDIDLVPLDAKTIALEANGYRITPPVTTEVNSVTLTQLLSLASTSLIAQAENNLEKIGTRYSLKKHSFIDILYTVGNRLITQDNYSVINVSSEATEIAIVRDGVLRTVTHTMTGTNTLARMIAEKTSILPDEALQYLKKDTEHSKKLTDAIEKVTTSYTEELSATFTTAISSLSFPKDIFLLTDTRYTEYFTRVLKNVTKTTTEFEHNILPIGAILFPESKHPDTAMQIIARSLESH